MTGKASREFSDTSRAKMADAGVAMPDGSYPIPDKGALGRAIQSFGRAKDKAATKQHIVKRAKALGATDMLPEGWLSGKKALVDMKAEPMDTGQLDRWLEGKIPRRILMLPFGGPLKAELFGYPSDMKGRDLDGEYADEATDIYGPFPNLRATRDRLVDWHHNDWGVEKVDPRASRMKGAIIGKAVVDATPEDDGYWADWWAQAGERRLALVKSLEERGTHLFGSTQAVTKAIVRGPFGHLDVWPIVRHTISTSPQNTLAVVPPLKAVLAADIPDDVGIAAVKAALVGIDARRLGASLADGGSGFRSPGKGSGKAVMAEAERIARDYLERYKARHLQE